MENEIPKLCPLCQSAIKTIPAGISKNSGRPYKEFHACSSFTCEYTWKPQTFQRIDEIQTINPEGVKVEKKDGFKEAILETAEAIKTQAEIMNTTMSVIRSALDVIKMEIIEKNPDYPFEKSEKTRNTTLGKIKESTNKDFDEINKKL